AGAEMAEAAAERDVGIERDLAAGPCPRQRAAMLRLRERVLPDGDRRIARVARTRAHITRQDPLGGVEIPLAQLRLHAPPLRSARRWRVPLRDCNPHTGEAARLAALAAAAGHPAPPAGPAEDRMSRFQPPPSRLRALERAASARRSAVRRL